MPSTIYESNLSDTGEAVMGGTRVLYVAWEVTTFGPTIHVPSSWDPDTLLRVGHWEIGNDLTPLGLISGTAFGEQHWINSERGQWIAPPGLVGSAPSYAIAQYIRWAMAPGTEVHLYVFGDV